MSSIGGTYQNPSRRGFLRLPAPAENELLPPPAGRSPSLDEGGMGMGKSRVCGISPGARCAPLQRGRNRNDEMRLQRWAASLQRLDAFATDGCIAVPRRGAHCAPVSYIAAPVTVITTMFREDARRVIGATAKPLYPIDGKAAGFDRRNPKTSLFEGGGPPQRWKESVPCRGAHCAPVRPRRYNNNPSRGRAKGHRGDRKAPISNRRQGRRP